MASDLGILISPFYKSNAEAENSEKLPKPLPGCTFANVSLKCAGWGSQDLEEKGNQRKGERQAQWISPWNRDQ